MREPVTSKLEPDHFTGVVLLKKFTSLFALTALMAAMPVPQLTKAASAQSNDKVCMTKKSGKRGGGKSVAVIVTKKSDESVMKARGFKKTNCKAKNAERQDYQKQMCKFAAIAPASVQAEFERDHGASPTELCQAAQ